MQDLNIGLFIEYFIIILSIGFLLGLILSSYRNKDKIQLYTIVMRADEDGIQRVSKVGIAFIFILFLVMYQTFTKPDISFYLVELLGITFAADIGTTFVKDKFKKDKKRIERDCEEKFDSSKYEI